VDGSSINGDRGLPETEVGEGDFCDGLLGEMCWDMNLGLCLRGIENLCERIGINEVESIVEN